jgi:hypothetical protein
MALYEARLRIATNNTVQKVFSTQDIVSCSQYSQGCDGGFPYLIAGNDYLIVDFILILFYFLAILASICQNFSFLETIFVGN